MKRMLDRLFSDAYVNRKTVGNNLLLLLMYRFAYPFSVLLNRLCLSPNQITSLSLVFSIFAFTALVLDEGWVWFAIFWGLAVLFDFCDGTVARMADKVSKSAFRYDHMSDLFKISLVILGAGLRYDQTGVWVMAFSACFTLLYGDALNREVHIAVNRLSSGGHAAMPRPGMRSGTVGRVTEWLSRYGLLYALVKTLWLVLLTVNGHTLLLFFVLPLGAEFSMWGFAYLTLIGLLAIRSRIAMLVSMRR